ncbi:IS1595 family transposase [Flavobacterium sp. SUN046]|uniref:IS1595 family transposase n=1 Tax=Flavobacterium sp. SUN046 TaxID=3002440 RepID=UPI002DBCE088|nr:IS1595 family transposase [Flavobacterium sp. SUN046]MEC4048331.1 IS1595 family transposase [Flavobacterium sp. SUN046]
MNLIEVNKNHNTQAKCLKTLEQLRWGKNVKCTFCDSNKVNTIKTEQGRYSCKNCKRSFSVIVGTIFEETRLPLPIWFQSIALMLNAKSGMSAKEIQRNFGITYKTAYYMCMRIRVGMLMPETKLNGIIEMDESYFGGKARSQHKIPDNEVSLANATTKRGRGTNKVSVVGMVQRKGNVKTKLIDKLTKRNLLFMLKSNAKNDNSILMTDGFKSYKELETYIDRLVINHSKEYSRGIVHINTIEGFWSYVKNGIKGSYKAISKKYLPLYLVEYEWKFNHRNFKGNELEKFLKNALFQEKELEHWKAQSPKQVKQIAYGNE